MNSNLKEISTFIKKNNSYSDFNLVNNFLLNLNFTKINFNKKKNLIGGAIDEEGFIIDDFGNRILDEFGNPIRQDLQPENMAFDNNLQPENMAFDNNLQPENMAFDNNLQPGTIGLGNDLQQQMMIEKIPDTYLKNPPFTSDQIDTYTITEGTILYHATSNKKGFNTNYLNLGNDKIINFFTPNFRLASDKIEGCSVDKQNGYIHVFKVKKDIPNIYVRLPYDIADDISSDLLANEFCSKNQNYYGIGFFYPKNNIEMFSNDINQYNKKLNLDNPDLYYSEFGLCNPKPYLEYLYTQRCQSLRKLSDPFRFN